jgi:DNA-directed RNA polymerase specialized sigma24 family protein
MNRDIQEAVDLYKRTSDEQVLNVLVRMLENYASVAIFNKQDQIEAKSDLNLVIYKSIKSYDPSKKVKFITFFWHCYKTQTIKSYVIKSTKKRGEGALEYSLNKKIIGEQEFGKFVPSKKNEIVDFMFDFAFQETLNKLRDQRDVFIIEHLYKGFAVTEISQMLGYTRVYIHQRIRRLRNHPVGHELYELLRERIVEKTA